MSGSFIDFLNSYLPSQTSFLNTTAAYDPSVSAYTATGWNYTPALTPSLLTTALTDGEASQSYALNSLTNLGAAEFSTINNDFEGWAGNQESFLTATTNILQTAVNNSANASGGLFGFLGF